jgi:hypothetical protein
MSNHRTGHTCKPALRPMIIHELPPDDSCELCVVGSGPVGKGPRPYRLAAHLRNAIVGAPRGAMDIYRILRDRFLTKPRKPGFLVPNRGGRYALHHHAEQVPTPTSRIRLTTETDAYGLPRAVIDLRYTDKDIDSVMESHRLLDHALSSNEIGRLEFWDSPDKRREKVWETASDGFHQIGSARMEKIRPPA